MTNPPAQRLLRADATQLHDFDLADNLKRAAPAGALKPWITVVLGSGWSPAGEREAYGRRLLETLTPTSGQQAEAPFSGSILARSLDDVVAEYALDLIQDRLSLDSLAPPEEPSVPSSDIGYRLMAACAATTSLFHGLKLLRPEAIKREGHDDLVRIALDGPSFWLRDELLERVVAMLRALRFDLQDTSSGVNGRLAEAAVQTISRLEESIQAQQLSHSAIQDLTELSWSVLISMTRRTFPGWADLMLELSHDDEEHQPVGAPRLADVETLGGGWLSEAIKSRYEPCYGSSEAVVPDVPALHSSVAALLEAQATTRHTDDPQPLAFVTSFDLELERALLDRKTAFRMIFPVHVSNKHRYHLTWLSLEVESDSDLNSLRRPSPARLKLVDDRSTYSKPTLVRLTGCPLIYLPDRGEPDPNELEKRVWNAGFGRLVGADLNREDPQPLDIRHAPICNEYLASYHTSFDLRSETSRLQDSASLPGLPIDSVVSVSHPWHRYWLMLGVQLGSPAIRQRLTAVLSLLPTFTSESELPTPKGSDPQPTGVVVAESIDWAAKDLLSWRGLRIVNGDANDLAPSIAAEAAVLIEKRSDGAKRPSNLHDAGPLVPQRLGE